MASVVDICNRALDLIGQPPITSLTDASKAASACNRNYPLSRDAVLSSYPWNSAVKRASLAALVSAPAYGYARQFQLPADCLRVLDSDGDLDGATWRREGRVLLTDEASPLRIRYVAQITDTTLFDPMLVEAIASHLAAAIAFQVAGSGEMQQRMLALHAQTIREARAMDARESSQDAALRADDWLYGRITG